jgi:hypothetical protein
MSHTENAIDKAVTDHARSEDWPGLVAGWVVLVALVDHDGEDGTSGVATIYPGGEMPWHSALGIVEAARTRMHQQFLTGR